MVEAFTHTIFFLHTFLDSIRKKFSWTLKANLYPTKFSISNVLFDLTNTRY